MISSLPKSSLFCFEGESIYKRFQKISGQEAVGNNLVRTGLYDFQFLRPVMGSLLITLFPNIHQGSFHHPFWFLFKCHLISEIHLGLLLSPLPFYFSPQHLTLSGTQYLFIYLFIVSLLLNVGLLTVESPALAHCLAHSRSQEMLLNE